MRINFIYQGQYAGSVMAGLAAPVANNLITTEPPGAFTGIRGGPLQGVPKFRLGCRVTSPDSSRLLRFRPGGRYLSQRGPQGSLDSKIKKEIIVFSFRGTKDFSFAAYVTGNLFGGSK